MGLKEISRLRKRLIMPIQIRGTSSAFPLPEQVPRYANVHSYYVNPRVQLSDRKFFEKFHATLAAAVGRALEHSKAFSHPRYMAHFHGVEKAEPELRFSIYAPNIRSLRQFRAMHRTSREPDSDRQHRSQYEEAVVDGGIRQTFSEHRGNAHHHQSWFKVRLSKRELKEVKQKAEKVAEQCIHDIEELPIEQQSLWQGQASIRKILKKNGYETPPFFPEETALIASQAPYTYVLYEEARKTLVRKALRRLQKKINQLPD